ncbi:tRNA pseudouridine synthase, putative [Theileria annulata]|uniref:tRNA pseudouridine synthase, putative n=1 Tax=Theileria annulata TaxID=5874 RepID=Q4UIU5_THEAN|nr:tRNA pseudouridine synthase, putative [Theileria annulata]CAI72994.1 tRNA pseudouridine synthase, putative [Theileria annulata]|eukprot:XP_953672.1 tRNA pseudouridine synthase, putative [Theileria annulata]
MNKRDRKRNRNEARSKFRKLWKEREQFLKNKVPHEDGIIDDDSSNLKDSEHIDKLNQNLGVKRVHAPKTKYVIAFGYLGTGYHGYQKQVEYKTGEMDKVKTVEGTLENCLFRIGAINEAFRNMTHKLQMSKCSRTDKGVHAACTYLGGRFNIEMEDVPEDHVPQVNNHSEINNSSKPDTSDNVELQSDGKLSKEEKFVQRLNAALPEDIRCFKIQRVTKGFDARSLCSKRKYEYIIPEWLLSKKFVLPNEEHEKHFRNLEVIFEENTKTKDIIKLSKLNDTLYEVKGGFEETEIEHSRLYEILKLYQGTHNFHNFTVKQKEEINNTSRFIHKISIKSHKIQELEVVKILIVGQSFLYNQIRKMISLALQVYLGIAPKNSVEFSLNKSHFLNINLVPSEGLILHHPYFDSYNMNRCNPPEVPYIEYKDVKTKVEGFKNKYIYPEVKKSMESDLWEGWLENILKYPFYLENNFVPDGESE